MQRDDTPANHGFNHLFWSFLPHPTERNGCTTTNGSEGGCPTSLGPVDNGSKVSHVEDKEWGFGKTPSKCPSIGQPRSVEI